MKKILNNLLVLIVGIALAASFSFVASASYTPVVPVSGGGTGVSTITGVLIGNGTSSVTGVTLPSVSTEFLNGNGTFSTPSGGGGGGVTSVSGTTNQIDVASGTTTPVISIDANYAGQSSITTLGTIATGVWNGNPIGTSYGGTGATSIGASLSNSGSVLSLNLNNANTFTAEQQVTLTTTQFQLNYDGTHNASFLVSSSGALTITSSGGTTVMGNATQVNGALWTSSTQTSANLNVASTANATTQSTSPYQIAGSTTNFLRTAFYGSNSSTLSTGANYSGVLVAGAPITAFSSGTHALLANLVVNPIGTITNSGSASITNTASLYVGGANAATVTNQNYAAWINGLFRVDLGSDATGDLLYRGSSGGLVRLGIGSTGKVLGVTSGVPAWQTGSGLGSYIHTIFTPTTGGTVALVDNQYNIINPSGALLALTVNLPSSPANNDVVYIKFTQNVTTVTYANGTVVDGITAPTAGGLTVLTYDSGTTSWY